MPCPCPARATHPGIDLVLVLAHPPFTSSASSMHTATGNPFVDYRGLVTPDQMAMANGMTDATCVRVVGGLERRAGGGG